MAVMSNGMILNKKIKDATATSSDVLSGKVFYNNDGRQVGTYAELIPDLKSIIIANVSSLPESQMRDSFPKSLDFDENGVTEGSSMTSTGGGSYQWYRRILTSITTLIGFRVNSTLFLTCISIRGVGQSTSCHTGNSDIDIPFYIVGGSIYMLEQYLDDLVPLGFEVIYK